MGFNTPEPVDMKGDDGETQTPRKKKKSKDGEPKGEKTLPENAQEKHPVQLLNEMAGPLVYEQTGQTGTPPACIFTLSVTVNEKPYGGQGKSKREAKKAAAQAALS